MSNMSISYEAFKKIEKMEKCSLLIKDVYLVVDAHLIK